MQPNDHSSRKKYRKPELRKFQLRPEEAVLGGCKSLTVNGSGTGRSTCRNLVFCQTAGS